MSKSEIRNKFKILMLKTSRLKPRFEHYFEFRASDFESVVTDNR